MRALFSLLETCAYQNLPVALYTLDTTSNSETMSESYRSVVYQASLEAYIVGLHRKLHEKGCCLIPPATVARWEGLDNDKAKVRVSAHYVGKYTY